MTTNTFSDNDLLVTGEHQIDDVAEHLGLVVANVTPGRHLGKDFLAGLRNIFGGRSRSWEKTLKKSQDQALNELIDKAKKMGADALVAVELEDESIGGANGGMMNIKAMGSAVKLSK